MEAGRVEPRLLFIGFRPNVTTLVTDPEAVYAVYNQVLTTLQQGAERLFPLLGSLCWERASLVGCNIEIGTAGNPSP